MAIIVFRNLKEADFDVTYNQLMYFVTGKVSNGNEERTMYEWGVLAKTNLEKVMDLRKQKNHIKANQFQIELDEIGELMRNAVKNATDGMSLPFFMTGINSPWFNKYGIKNNFNERTDSWGNYKNFIRHFIQNGQPFSYKEFLTIQNLRSQKSQIGFECHNPVAVVKEGFKKKLNSTTAIPTTITIIRQEAFAETLLTYVQLTDVVNIEDKAFKNCVNLKEVELPSCLSVIGNSAFEGCKSMMSITLSKSLNQLGTDVFKECESLTITKITNLDSVDPLIGAQIKKMLGIGDDDDNNVNECNNNTNNVIFDIVANINNDRDDGYGEDSDDNSDDNTNDNHNNVIFDIIANINSDDDYSDDGYGDDSDDNSDDDYRYDSDDYDYNYYVSGERQIFF